MNHPRRTVAILAFAALGLLLQSCLPAAPAAASTPSCPTAAPAPACPAAPTPAPVAASTLACPAVPTAPACPAASAAVSALPFEGTWVSDQGSLLVLHPDKLYHRYQEYGAQYEKYAAIKSYDLENGQMLIHYKTIVIDGKARGFDSPEWRLKYTLNEDRLQIRIESMQYPTTVDPEIYFKK